MHLNQLELLNFKNLADQNVDFHPKANCFFGLNSMGKTNVLDAIYYLSFCKSFLNPTDYQNIKEGHEFFLIKGNFSIASEKQQIAIGVQAQKKKVVKRNEDTYKSIADHIGLIPLVIISPEDVELIALGSDLRRKFMDGVIAQFNKTYLNHLLNYNKALQQRNKLLKSFADNKSFDATLLEMYNLSLQKHGLPIFEMRQQFVKDFIPFFQTAYKKISGGNDNLSLNYLSQLSNGDFLQLLNDNLQRDRLLKFTSVGIHKDDLEFLIENKIVKRFGSQGQKKTFVIAMKMAQYHYISMHMKTSPLLLLDDIFDKLDEERVKAIVQLVNEKEFGQIFITDTDFNRLENVFGESTNAFFFKVQQGRLQKV